MCKRKEWYCMGEEVDVIAFAKYRLERAKEDLSDAEYNYKDSKTIEPIILFFMQLEQY